MMLEALLSYSLEFTRMAGVCEKLNKADCVHLPGYFQVFWDPRALTHLTAYKAAPTVTLQRPT